MSRNISPEEKQTANPFAFPFMVAYTFSLYWPWLSRSCAPNTPNCCEVVLSPEDHSCAVGVRRRENRYFDVESKRAFCVSFKWIMAGGVGNRLFGIFLCRFSFIAGIEAITFVCCPEAVNRMSETFAGYFKSVWQRRSIVWWCATSLSQIFRKLTSFLIVICTLFEVLVQVFGPSGTLSVGSADCDEVAFLEAISVRACIWQPDRRQQMHIIPANRLLPIRMKYRFVHRCYISFYSVSIRSFYPVELE